MKYLDTYKLYVAKSAVHFQQRVSGVVDLRLKVDSTSRFALAEFVLQMGSPPSRRLHSHLLEPFRTYPGDELWASEVDIVLLATRAIRWEGGELEVLAQGKVDVLWQAFTCGPGSASEKMRFYEQLFINQGAQND